MCWSTTPRPVSSRRCASSTASDKPRHGRRPPIPPLSKMDGIHQMDTTLHLWTPGKSAVRSTAAVGEDQQQRRSPLLRGHLVPVKSPEAIRMDVEDEVKRDLIKEIVRTPGVALRRGRGLVAFHPLDLAAAGVANNTTPRGRLPYPLQSPRMKCRKSI